MRQVTALSITPQSDDVVSFGGRIERTVNYYELSWTESRDGYIDTDYRSGFPDFGSALKYAADNFTHEA